MKKRWYDYLWIAELIYLSLGFFNILFAWLKNWPSGIRNMTILSAGIYRMNLAVSVTVRIVRKRFVCG